jgi:hypothetical protein
VKTCWKPAVRKNPNPKQARYIFSLSFDARGVERGRGISEIRGQSRADVAQCLRRLRMGLKIPAPGYNVTVRVPLVFP